MLSSVGSTGIDALKLHSEPYNLIGRKIAIGQVETGRPGQFGFDKAVSRNYIYALAQAFFRDTPAKPNTDVEDHAGMVASVMVSKDKTVPGVAPGARLFASAAGTSKNSGQIEECLSTQHVAVQNGGDVRAINFSFGEPLSKDPRPDAVLDGNALLTQCVDWSARVHDVVYVIAGNQGKGGIAIPTDNFNGMTIAYTARREGIFTKIDYPNLSDAPLGVARSLIEREINVGGRRGISLAAPGANLSLYDMNGKLTRSNGSSFAAPHVVGTVALLQEFGDRAIAKQLKDKIPLTESSWNLNARRHEVMKAVLINSTDKIKDKGDGLNLNMSRTILRKDNQNWLESDAYRDRKIPLEYQMGAGQLNAFRAYQQFSSGQWQPEKAVPAIGWNYGSISESTYQDYAIDSPLKKGSFISVTLTWDRLVELQDKNQNGIFDAGERFKDRGLNNLNIYLMKAEDNNTDKSIWSSESDVDSVEHIFHQIPEKGRYKIRVQYNQKVNEQIQPYALAWWSITSK
ncbi:peptidase S8 and S53 subtilisin kexin sedolisin [Merismopedia glauca CCAP 1448/3]|uniref:Peptidase S8 and S53 subtilisin kexin sedolisin n=2 Tax=Merismopedia TaxID=53402 RepID=A0A2T1C0H5_9CYAN|nr:peptidase S8 and S53 subtilisin kexin sedolisin [Merismopedia glauca CCAP 1448/3]